jgi:hypothetical protein
LKWATAAVSEHHPIKTESPHPPVGNPAQPDHAFHEVVQRGYQKGVKVVRPAKVMMNDLTTSKPVRHGL